MPQFNVEIILPSGRKCRVEELSNREYLSIIKFAQNSDYAGLSNYFEDKYIEPDMHIFDRFYLLVYIRMLFIESSITLEVNKRTIDISLDSLLNNLEANYIDLETKFEENGIEIILDLPQVTYYNNIDDLYISTIKQVKIADDIVIFSSLNAQERLLIMDNLPATIFVRIKKYIQTIQDNLLDIDIISENKSIGVQKLSVNIIGNGVMHFISSLYGTDLKGFYTLIYMFQNTILPGSNYFFDMSPVETQIILNAHSKKVKDENDKLQKQKQR